MNLIRLIVYIVSFPLARVVIFPTRGLKVPMHICIDRSKQVCLLQFSTTTLGMRLEALGIRMRNFTVQMTKAGSGVERKLGYEQAEQSASGLALLEQLHLQLNSEHS